MASAIPPNDPWHALSDHKEPNREQLAKYLNRVGRGINCRIDVPVLVLEDVKWAAKVFGDLSRELTKISFEDTRPEIWRILGARYAMESAKRELHLRNERKTAQKVFRKAAERGNY